MINSNKRLEEIFEQKIKTKIAEVWGIVAEPVEAKEEVKEYNETNMPLGMVAEG